MAEWRTILRHDPVPALLAARNPAITYFTRRDLLGEKVGPLNPIWKLPEPRKIIKKQSTDGAWPKAGPDPAVYPPYHYRLVETFKKFRTLVVKYQFTKEHPALAKAADFLQSCQAPEGDIRGFSGNQYATYYTGEVLALLIKAGYAADPRIIKGLDWLLSLRQDDGGWTIPLLTHSYNKAAWRELTSRYTAPVLPDRTKPFSHNWTDMVLRSFAAHPEYKKLKEAKTAGALLKSSFFRPDVYSSYQSPRYWTRFLFWWPNLLTALESLYLLGFTKDDPDIQKGLNWFKENQQPDGLWKLENDKEIKVKDTEERGWVGLTICRVMKRFYE